MKVLTKDGLSYFWSKIKNFLDGKLDTISDLNTIRYGAALGATALLSYTETDPTVPSHVKSITLTNINAWNEAEANVQSDWNQTTTTADDYIKNKPDIPDDLSDLNDDSTHRLVTDTEKATWNGKQDTLVSGTNLKTINNESLLGSGNISIQGGGGSGDNHVYNTSRNALVISPTTYTVTVSGSGTCYDRSGNAITFPFQVTQGDELYVASAAGIVTFTMGGSYRNPDTSGYINGRNYYVIYKVTSDVVVTIGSMSGGEN